MGRRMAYLPAEASITEGYLYVPRETRVTFRLNLQDPAVRDRIDLSNVTWIHFFKGTAETTFYLDGFQLLMKEDVHQRETRATHEVIREAQARLARAGRALPGAYSDRVKAMSKTLQSLLSSDSLPEAWKLSVATANQLSTLLEMRQAAAGADPGSYALLPVSSMTKVFRDEAFSIEPTPLQISAAGHERVSFQVVVVPQRPLSDLQAKVAALIHTVDASQVIPADQVEVNPVGYVEVPNSFYYRSSREGWWPDPLIRNQPLAVDECIQPIWITVHVPSGQAAGRYRGEVTFSAEGEPDQAFAYELKVRDFSLPVHGTLQTVLSFTYKPKDQATRRQVYETLLEHRISPVNMYINGSVQFGYQPAREDLQFCIDR